MPATSRPTARSASARGSRATGRCSWAPQRCSTTCAASREKWLADLAADQWPDGRVPTVIPNPAGDGPSGVVFEDLSAGSAGWGDAAVLVPWELWRSLRRPRGAAAAAAVDAALGAVRGERGGGHAASGPRRPPGPSRRRGSGTSGTRASTSASGSSPACRRGPIRRSTTRSSPRRSCTARRTSPRHPPSCSARPSSRPSARASPTARSTRGRREFVTAPGRLAPRVAGELRARPRVRAVPARRPRRGSRAPRRAHRRERRAPRHRLPQHGPAAARPRRPRPGGCRLPHAPLDGRALVARHARARRDHRLGVVGRHRRRRHRARLAQPLQQGRRALLPVLARRGHPARCRTGGGCRGLPPRAHRAAARRRPRVGARVARDASRPALVGVALDDGRFTLEVEVPAGCAATVELPDGSTRQASGGRHTFTSHLAPRA